jgi:small nuclear ribonucleoprotein (snRNP)-like protein
MNVERLRCALKKNVLLTFRDGEVVEALLLGVDDARNHDLTYEVTRVVDPGPRTSKATEIGATYIAPLAELADWSSS